MKKRFLAFILIGMIASAVLVGCGKRGESIDGASESSQEKSGGTEESTQTDDKVKKFTRKPDAEVRDSELKITSIGWYEDEYDDAGNLIKLMYYSNDTDMKSKVGTLYYWEEYGYDANGNMAKHIVYDADGNIDRWTEYEYDADDRISKYIEYNPDGSIKESKTVE